MSILKMVLHVEKPLKTTIQKNLSKSQKFPRKISVVEFRYSQTIFFAVHSNFAYDSEAYDPMKLYFEALHEITIELKSYSQYVKKTSTEPSVAQSSKGPSHTINHTTPPTPSPKQVHEVN